MQPEVNFDSSINQRTKMMWRNIIMSGFRCLIEDEKRAMPPFYIYNTMIQCLNETFNPSHPMVDKLADRFSEEKVWAFAFLQDPIVRNSKIPEARFQRIVVASSRNELTPDLSPEMVIFHEMGHFVLFNMMNVPLTTRNLEDVESECNTFALKLYMRLMILFPNYRTNSIDRSVIEFENELRNMVEGRNINTCEEARDFIEKVYGG